MERVCYACLVGSDAANLYGRGSVRGASIGKRRSGKGNSLISSGQNQIANEAFVSIDNEITTELLRLLVVRHEFSGRHRAKVTPDGLEARETQSQMT